MKESIRELSPDGDIPFDANTIDGSSEMNDINLWCNNVGK